MYSLWAELTSPPARIEQQITVGERRALLRMSTHVTALWRMKDRQVDEIAGFMDNIDSESILSMLD